MTVALAAPPLRRFHADRGDDRERLDRVLVRRLADLALARVEVARWVRAGKVAVNGAAVLRPAQRLFHGDEIAVALPPPPPDAPALVAQELPLRVLFEDEHLLAVAKPAALVVHPTWGHRDGTLLNGLLWQARAWDGATQRPRLVHRLDKDTSGVLLVAKTRAAHAGLARAFQRRQVRKEYLAVVHGRPAERHGRIDAPLARDEADPKRRVVTPAGLPSLTAWELLAEGALVGATCGSEADAPADVIAREPVALLRCRPETGRTHQIRVHLAARGMPIVGDPLYGDGAIVFARQALHAWRIAFEHPVRAVPMTVEAPLADDLRALLAAAGIAPP